MSAYLCGNYVEGQEVNNECLFKELLLEKGLINILERQTYITLKPIAL